MVTAAHGSASSTQAEPALVVAGAGAAGTGLAAALHELGWPVAVLACRTTERASARVALVGAGRGLTLAQLHHDDCLPAAPLLLLLTVPDARIAELAEQLSRRSWPAGSVALHCSGSVELDALAPLRAAGLCVGGCHPLRSFVDPPGAAASLIGTVFAVEGDGPAHQLAHALALRLGGLPFDLKPGARAAWHAAASHVANHFVALVDQSLDLAEAAGLSRDDARAAFIPLLSGILHNLGRSTPAAALTGPVSRGDIDVVARHLAALSTLAPDVDAAYRALATRAVQLAVTGRGLSADQAQALLLMLQPGTPP